LESRGVAADHGIQLNPATTGPTTTTTTTPSTATTTTTTTTAPTTTTTAPPPPAGLATPLVTSFTPSRLRQDFSGWVGMTVRVGGADVRVSALGRWVVNGNRGAHTVKLVDASTGA